MTNSSSYEDTIVTNLHIYEAAVLNVHSLINIILDATSSNYARWHDNMMLALTRYTLTDHVESDDAFSDNPGWTWMDAVILYWHRATPMPQALEPVPW
jgi:hypothetical protein